MIDMTGMAKKYFKGGQTSKHAKHTMMSACDKHQDIDVTNKKKGPRKI